MNNPERFATKYFERYAKSRWGWSAASRWAYLYRSRVAVINRYSPGATTVVEVGCGVGYMSRHLARLPGIRRLISSDLSRDALHIAQTNLSNVPTVELCQVDAQVLPFPNDAADVVVAIDIIEHLEYPERFFKEVFRVLRPGGVLMIATPNPASLGCALKANGLTAAAKNREGDRWLWSGFRDPTHINIRSIGSWRELYTSLGFQVVRDGTDFCWDAPYFRHVPVLLQEVFFKGVNRIVTVLLCFLPWTHGENYIAVCRKPREPANC